MIDKTNINIVDLIGQDIELKYCASTNGGEYKGACPFCGGKDRFCVWPESGRYWCRQCTKSGDAIDYVRETRNLDFHEACAYLHLDMPRQPSAYSPQSKQQPSVKVSRSKSWVALEDPAWQQAATAFCQRSEERLWSEAGEAHRAYLHKRGLSDDIIRLAKLGMNPHDRHEHWSYELEDDVWLPKGLVIPWQIGDRLWRVNIRQTKKRTPKYIQAAGGANGLYGADTIMFGSRVIMVEGEFDALVLQAQLSSELIYDYQIVPVATGSATGSRLRRWLSQIALAERVLLAFDTDAGGQSAVSWWANALGEKATYLRPTQHDITDMVKAGDDLEAWLLAALT